MIITNIKKQKQTESRYNIFIDSKFCFSAANEDIIKYSITEGKEIDKDDLENLIKKCEESTAYNYALILLNTRDYTSKDIRTKLKQKHYSEQTINIVLSKLQLYEFINDERFAKKYIDYSLNIKKIGRNKIMYDLQNRGIKNSDIESIEFDDEIQYSNAYNLALKKLKSIKNTAKPEEKVFRYLLSKGYEFDTIKKVLRKIFDNIDNDF